MIGRAAATGSSLRGRGDARAVQRPHDMRSRLAPYAALLALAVAGAAACNDSPTAPDPARAATQAADRFDRLADSLTSAGSYDDADFAQAMADLIRSVGRVDNVVVKVDGRSVTHTTLAIEALVPSSACDNSTDPAYCRELNPPFSQVVFGWTGTDLREGFMAYSEQSGTASAAYDGGATLPPAFVTYTQRDVNASDIDLFGAPARSWYSDGGTVTMPLGVRGASCELPPGTEPGASYTCHKASFSPAFDVTASEYTEAGTSTRHITMAAQRADGVSVEVTEVFDNGPFTVARAARRRTATPEVRALVRRVAPVFLRRAPASR